MGGVVLSRFPVWKLKFTPGVTSDAIPYVSGVPFIEVEFMEHQSITYERTEVLVAKMKCVSKLLAIESFGPPCSESVEDCFHGCFWVVLSGSPVITFWKNSKFGQAAVNYLANQSAHSKPAVNGECFIVDFFESHIFIVHFHSCVPFVDCEASISASA